GSAHRRWVRNLRRDGHVALLVLDGDDTLHWVGIRGIAGPPTEGPGAVDDAKRIAVRYGEDPSEYEGLQRVSYRITPRHVYEYAQRWGPRLKLSEPAPPRASRGAARPNSRRRTSRRRQAARRR